jgi:zinc transport system substrate-binding protein
MSTHWCVSASVVVLAIAVGCSRTEREPAAAPSAKPAGKPVVAAVNYPLTYFAGRLAGDAVSILFTVPAGEDPAFWEPAESDILRYQAADLILLNGADYGQWLRMATLPESRMVNTSAAFADAYLQFEHAVTHSHGPEGAHEHGLTDFNTWLDPRQARRQAEAVRDALVRLMPDARGAIEGNFKALSSDLGALDDRLAGVSRTLGKRPLLASHPVYGYLARRYAWSLESVHWEPGEMPPEEEWNKLSDLLKRHPATLMIWEDEPRADVAARLGPLGVKCVVFRPCGNRPPEGDYLSEMRLNTERLAKAL